MNALQVSQEVIYAVLGGGGLVVGLLLGALTVYVAMKRRETESPPPLPEDGNSVEAVEDPRVPDPDEVFLEKPDLKTVKCGMVGELLLTWRHLKKRRKLAGKGYVEWRLVGDTFPTPKYVKPTEKGGGMLEYKHDGQTYLFPKDAMVPNEDQGLWTIMHEKGDANPINLKDPLVPAIKSDALEEYLTMRVSASRPSFLDKFDMNAQDAMTYAIAGTVLIAGVFGAINGGFV
jgi:hypothetical protein